MDSSCFEIFIPTIVNCHLFWIFPKKNLLVRCAMNRTLKARPHQKIVEKSVDKYLEHKMVAVNIDNIWTRGIIEEVLELSQDGTQFLCWLPDYGLKRVVKNVYQISEHLQKCPYLAQQASLYDVVNLMTDFSIGATGYEFKLKKTINDIEGVRKVALDCIEGAHKLFFKEQEKDEFNVYGDIICCDERGKEQSLTDFLIKKKLVAVDKDLFNTIDSRRKHYKDAYFKHSQMWQQQLDRMEIQNLSEIILNKEVNGTFPNMELFNRMRISSR